MGVQGANLPKNFECKAMGGLKMSYPDSMFQEFANNRLLNIWDVWFQYFCFLSVFPFSSFFFFFFFFLILTESRDFHKNTDWKH